MDMSSGNTDTPFENSSLNPYARNNLLLIGVIILVLTVIGSGIFLSLNKNTSSDVQSSHQVITISPTPRITTGEIYTGNASASPSLPLSPTLTCIPRPACLNSVPRCLIAEPAEGWCPPTSMMPVVSCTPRPAQCQDTSKPCTLMPPVGGWCPQ